MASTDSLEKECRVFTRYLADCLPDTYVSRKYAEAFQTDGILSTGSVSSFESMLLGFALIHPFFTRAADIFSRFFYADSLLRKKLVLLLAILESWAPMAERVDSSRDSGKLYFFLAMMLHGLLSLALLVITIILFLPWLLVSRFGQKRVV